MGNINVGGMVVDEESHNWIVGAQGGTFSVLKLYKMAV